MKLFSDLTTAERKQIRDVITQKLELYQVFKSTNSLDDEQVNFCNRIEQAVNRLPNIEKNVISKRYLHPDSEYVTDYAVYSMEMEPPISSMTYSKIRDNAMIKLSLALGIDTGVKIKI